MYPLMGLDPRLIDPALVDQLATDPFQPEQGLLQRLLPMLMAPQGQTPGFGGPRFRRRLAKYPKSTRTHHGRP
jgi:hypothetical protein